MIDISTSGALSISGSPVTTFLGTLEKISNTSASAFIGGSQKNSFMMTNSPIAAKPGNDVSNQNVTTLVPVTIYESKEAADMADSKSETKANMSISPTFLIQAGELLESQGKKADALKIYQDIKTKYVNAPVVQNSEIDKYIERVSE